VPSCVWRIARRGHAFFFSVRGATASTSGSSWSQAWANDLAPLPLRWRALAMHMHMQMHMHMHMQMQMHMHMPMHMHIRSDSLSRSKAAGVHRACWTATSTMQPISGAYAKAASLLPECPESIEACAAERCLRPSQAANSDGSGPGAGLRTPQHGSMRSAERSPGGMGV